jgi:hypothetical protein
LKHPVGFISLLFWDSNGTEEWDNNSGRSNLPSLSSIPFPIAVPSSLGNPEDKPHSQVVGNRFMEAQARVKAGANAKI